MKKSLVLVVAVLISLICSVGVLADPSPVPFDGDSIVGVQK